MLTTFYKHLYLFTIDERYKFYYIYNMKNITELNNKINDYLMKHIKPEWKEKKEFSIINDNTRLSYYYIGYKYKTGRLLKSGREYIECQTLLMRSGKTMSIAGYLLDIPVERAYEEIQYIVNTFKTLDKI